MKKLFFFHTWIQLRPDLHLATGQLALINASFLITNAYSTVNDGLFSIMALKHSGIDTDSFRKERCDFLNGFDFLSTLAP